MKTMKRVTIESRSEVLSPRFVERLGRFIDEFLPEPRAFVQLFGSIARRFDMRAFQLWRMPT